MTISPSSGYAPYGTDSRQTWVLQVVRSRHKPQSAARNTWVVGRGDVWNASSVPGPRDYSASTRAALAMLSRARCYFPGCPEQILRFLDEEPYIDYQIAHIRDANPGNRYVAGMTDDERRAFSNLILLCKPHHELVDRRHPDRYSIEDLEGWKRSREGSAIGALAQVGPISEDSLAGLLTQSVADVQAQVTGALRLQEISVRRRVQAVRDDACFHRVQDAFDAVGELSLLSPLGVRAEAPMTDFFMRLRRAGTRLMVHLDTRSRASLFGEPWEEDQPFSDVMTRLARQVRPTPYWPGAARWEFASAVDGVVDVLIAGLDVKARGGWINNAVQLVGSNWLLSDWEALGVRHGYQVLYSRLDEGDWYEHLITKPWTDRSEVAQMLDHAMFLRDLAAAVQVHDDGGTPN